MDIHVEILKRLPVRSLLRFKCVQKSWYHLIQSPYFIHLHANHQENKNKYLLFQGRYHSKFFLRVDDKQCKEYYPRLRFPIPNYIKKRGVCLKEIHGTCRGLICFSVEIWRLRLHQVHLWNPVIRISKTLPDSPIPYDDPIRWPCVLGLAFGYFPDINDYKVVKIERIFAVRGDPSSRFATVYIYSLNTNSWKTVDKYKVAQFSSYDRIYNPVVVNGVAYWVGIRDSFIRVIVCFDIEKEAIREITLPPGYSYFTQNIFSLDLVEHLGEVVLYAVCKDLDANTSCILDIFGVDGGCTKKFTIDLTKVGQNWWPIGFRSNGEIVVFNYHYTERGFLSYDRDKEVATEILDDSWDLWYYADIDTPDEPRYHHYNDGIFDPFDYEAKNMQPMYVNSLEENLVLLGDHLWS